MPSALDLIQEIEKLPPAERLRMIDRVIRDTIKPDAESEKLWEKEAVERWDAFEQGEITAVPYEKVLARYREKK